MTSQKDFLDDLDVLIDKVGTKKPTYIVMNPQARASLLKTRERATHWYWRLWWKISNLWYKD